MQKGLSSTWARFTMLSLRCVNVLAQSVVIAALTLNIFFPPGTLVAHRSSVVNVDNARFTVLTPWLVRQNPRPRLRIRKRTSP